jgi:hypothetical protein
MLVLMGGRYRFAKMFPRTEAGVVIKASDNASMPFIIVPSAGYIHYKFSGEIRLLQVPGIPSFPENSFLKKDGYNFLGVRLSYQVL